MTQSQNTQSILKFSAVTDDLKVFHSSLKAIHFSESANFEISEQGIRIIVENSKEVQANLYMTRESFSEFQLNSNDTICFGVNLNVLTECMSIFAGVDCRMKMFYKDSGSPLILILERHRNQNDPDDHDDVLTECSIKTENLRDPLEFNLNEGDDDLNSIIIRGADSFNLFNEIDKSAEQLEILLSPGSPYFRISTIGVMQSESYIDVSKTSDMILSFSCKRRTAYKYKIAHIKLLMKALALGSKISIRTDSIGLMSIQVMVLCDKSAQIYIEFYVISLLNEDTI